MATTFRNLYRALALALDDLAVAPGIEESHDVWFSAGFNPYLDPVNRP